MNYWFRQALWFGVLSLIAIELVIIAAKLP